MVGRLVGVRRAEGCVEPSAFGVYSQLRRSAFIEVENEYAARSQSLHRRINVFSVQFRQDLPQQVVSCDGRHKRLNQGGTPLQAPNRVLYSDLWGSRAGEANCGPCRWPQFESWRSVRHLLLLLLPELSASTMLPGAPGAAAAVCSTTGHDSRLAAERGQELPRRDVRVQQGGLTTTKITAFDPSLHSMGLPHVDDRYPQPPRPS